MRTRPLDLGVLLGLNNNRAHTHDHNTYDNTEEDQTDGVCIF